MNRTPYQLAILLSGLLLGSGCSMCCGVYDYDYPTYGGLIQRSDRSHGRVGSIFSDPNAPLGVPVAEGVEEVKDEESFGPDMRRNNLDPRDPAPVPQNSVPQPMPGQPAEELKEELLRDFGGQSAANGSIRMPVQPAQAVQRQAQPAAPQRIGSRWDGQRIRNLFQ